MDRYVMGDLFVLSRFVRSAAWIKLVVAKEGEIGLHGDFQGYIFVLGGIAIDFS